jgi:hypothetical protein
MSNRGGSSRLFIRLGFLVVLGAIAVIVAMNVKSPLAVTESEVKQMVRDKTLVGLTLSEAAKKLQHEPPDTVDGMVVFEFANVDGWNGGSVVADVMNGKVTAASWLSPGQKIDEGSDVRQDQGNGTDGGVAQGQGAPTGIRAKNQTSSGGGPR